MEKYARQAVSEGVKCVDDIHITLDSEIYRVLNLHYNRNNHIEVCCLQVNLILYHLQFILFIFLIVSLCGFFFVFIIFNLFVCNTGTTKLPICS